MPKFGTKNALLGPKRPYLDQKDLTWTKKTLLGPKRPYLSIFGVELENNVVIFEISTLEFV